MYAIRSYYVKYVKLVYYINKNCIAFILNTGLKHRRTRYLVCNIVQFLKLSIYIIPNNLQIRVVFFNELTFKLFQQVIIEHIV